MQMENSAESRRSRVGGLLRWKNIIVSVALITSIFQTVGCRTSSPVMLQLPSEKTGNAAIPAKIGINPIVKSGSSRICDIGFIMFPVYFLDAKMPRRTETDYVLQSVADHVNDNRIFQYAYITPFDVRKVNLTMDVVFDRYELSNAGGGTYATIMNFPFINLLTLVGVPQEIFKSDIRATCILKTAAGAEISRYTFASKSSDAVTLYAMPYGNYLWYESMFRQQFDMMMTSFYRGIEADKEKILVAIQNPK